VGVCHWQHLWRYRYVISSVWLVPFVFILYGFWTAFTSYGAFWLSFATLLIPGSGIGDAYAASKNPEQEVDAIAIYLTAWMVVTFLFLFVLVIIH